MNWGYYWKVKKKHIAKGLCVRFAEIDSFEMIKYKEGLEWVRSSKDRLCFQTFEHNLRATLMDDDSLSVSYDAGSYIIPVEKKPCNYGGFYRFFHCPQCDKRMRKLYLLEGKYLCRKCANLGYYSQRLRPSQRCLYMCVKVEDSLHNMAGSLDRKPPWKKQRTLQRLRKKYLDYSEKHFYAFRKELVDWYGTRMEESLDDHYSFFVPAELRDLYDYK